MAEDPKEIAQKLTRPQRTVLELCIAHERRQAQLTAENPRRVASRWFAYAGQKRVARRLADLGLFENDGFLGCGAEVASTPLGRQVAAELESHVFEAKGS